MPLPSVMIATLQLRVCRQRQRVVLRTSEVIEEVPEKP